MKEKLEGLEYRKIALILLACILGLSLGLAVSQNFGSNDTGAYCDNIESQVMQKKNFSGNLACFPPGIVQVNLSEEIRNNSELRCVCRHEYKGVEQIIPVSFSY